jgi:outer membrane receptor protein involved in Fe transport
MLNKFNTKTILNYYIFTSSIIFSNAVNAGGEQLILEPIAVLADSISFIGIADSANMGTVTKKQLESRAVYRPAELLEAAPGLVVTQHSGEGKANQFFLRGINLDHGTDLRTSVDGILVNQRSHAHGQGWTDLNFLIPELASGLEYKKGTYYAKEGDFSSAGTVSIQYADTLAKGIASVGIGENGYRRLLLADSPEFYNGHLLYAIEAFHNDGPFRQPDDFDKLNAVLRYSEGNLANGFNVSAMAYKGEWNATDQIPTRGLASGFVPDRFGFVDTTDGGKAHRYSLSADWRKSDDNTMTKINAYVVHSKLDLFSNFTYFLDDPVNGDQFAQPDRRTTTAANASHEWQTSLLGFASSNTVGLQFQNDNIFNALLNTSRRQTLSVTRQDHIVESSVGAFFENSTTWTDYFRTVAGIRQDYYRFDVNSDLVANSGVDKDSIGSPKLSFIFGPWAKTEYYINLGTGFHSNDARGSTLKIDPKTGLAADKVSPLVRSKGREIGLRTSIIPNLQTSLTFYELDFDSELVFLGDAGTTEAGRPSRRRGFELANYYKLNDWLTVDADIAYARARFKDSDPAGNRITGAVEGVASLALSVDNLGPYFGSLQFRYFGPRPLIEDNSVRSSSTATLNAKVGYKFNKDTYLELSGFNLFNREDSAIDYFYTSRLPNEPAEGVDDVHFHPIESRSFRLNLVTRF